MEKKKDSSLYSQGLRYKLKIALCLMSVLPLLVCLYLVSNYIFPRVGVKLDILVTIAVSITIIIIGFLIVKEVFNRFLSISSDVKLIAAGDVTRIVDAVYDDEVGDLGEAINQLTSRIRNSMEELNSYSEKTTEINLEIQKRVQILSALLQTTSLITQGGKLEDILRSIVEKSRSLSGSDVVYLLFMNENNESLHMKIADGMNSGDLLKIKIASCELLFNRFTKINKPFVLDRENPLPENLRCDFFEKFKLINTLAIPIYLRGKTIAVFGVGNYSEIFLFEKEIIELLDVFAKQIAIAVENDMLMHRVKKLEIKDALTGLYNEVFIRNRLQEEIKRAIAYQRPCALIVFNIDRFLEFHQEFGALQAEGVLKRIGALIKDSATEIHRVARVGDHKFAIVLPECNKRSAFNIAEDIRKKVEFMFSSEQNSNKRITVTGGVSENPLDGIEAQELIDKAESLIANSMKMQEKNRILI